MVYLGKRQKGKQAEMVFSSGKKEDLRAGFTLILCFSRLWCFRKFFESFEKMKIPLENCNLLIIDNSNNTALRDALLNRAREYSEHFLTVRLYKTWRLYQRPLLTKKVISWKDSQNGPILGMHIDAMKLCKTDKFVMIEDDTLCPPDAVTRLLSLLHRYPDCGFATGIQAMRQSAAYLVTYPAVYYVTRNCCRIYEMVTPSPYLRGVHRVDGSGWYCFASYKNLFSRTTRLLLKVDDKTRNFAVDVLGVSYMNSLGYDVLADFDLWTEHYSKLQGDDFIWKKKHCKPMVSMWIPKWKTYMKATNLSEQEHYKLLRKLTKKKDRGLK